MPKLSFSQHAVTPGNFKWTSSVKRITEIYNRPDDIRSDFARDYNRILHCTAYGRLKHKTQVFFATKNDHICTRIEHVNHVCSVSYTIANFLGLNTELTNAIAIGHDLGHAPFGHAGETAIKVLIKEHLKDNFWHEKNSLRFVDQIETLEDPDGNQKNLNLTYAVRDGIICHCGEVDENGLFPREEPIDLYKIQKPNGVPPYTWEGCVVKVSDKIAYLGRDIQDALNAKILTKKDLKALKSIMKKYENDRIKRLNNTVIMHNLIVDLCKNSAPEKGISISPKYVELMNSIKKFNYDHIYKHYRLNTYKEYVTLIINSLFDVLLRHRRKTTGLFDYHNASCHYPKLSKHFSEWLAKYGFEQGRNRRNQKLYNLDHEKDYKQAAIDFISGMTDQFAIMMFQEVITF
ncbi:MAG: HD domain-containing protein [Pseudodesulfovibrio sp.]